MTIPQTCKYDPDCAVLFSDGGKNWYEGVVGFLSILILSKRPRSWKISILKMANFLNSLNRSLIIEPSRSPPVLALIKAPLESSHVSGGYVGRDYVRNTRLCRAWREFLIPHSESASDFYNLTHECWRIAERRTGSAPNYSRNSRAMIRSLPPNTIISLRTQLALKPPPQCDFSYIYIYLYTYIHTYTLHMYTNLST